MNTMTITIDLDLDDGRQHKRIEILSRYRAGATDLERLRDEIEEAARNTRAILADSEERRERERRNSRWGGFHARAEESGVVLPKKRRR